MDKVCKKCEESFVVTEDDLKFLQRVSPVYNGVRYDIPAPTFCPDCRQQRRLTFNNEMNLYKRSCGFSGKEILSVFSKDKPYIVYEPSVWRSDKWNALDYGRNFDFSRPFFEQFDELLKSVPLLSVFVMYEFDVNSEYTNNAGNNKDCYLIFHADFNELCYYGYGIKKCQNCMDCYNATRCELCYQCVHCVGCYNLKFSVHSRNCSDSAFLDNCTGCRDCLLCFGLTQARFCFMNKQYSEEDYRELVKHYDLRSHHGLQELLSLWKEGRGQYPQDSNYNFGSDDCSGDYIVNAKNCNNSYMVGEECRDCVNMFNAFPRLTDAMNGAYSGEDSELMYETICSGASCSRLFFCHVAVLGSHDLYYCNAAYNCQDCFGCSSIRGAQYCILNKQYSREEYFIMRDSIIEHMKKTGEWGQFFPPEMSLCGYNKSVAGDFFPLSQEEVLERGWKWEEDGEITVREGCEVIDNINDVEVEVCVQVLSCEVTGSPYKILPMELAFYRRIEIAIPQKCPEQRYLERLEMCNKVKL